MSIKANRGPGIHRACGFHCTDRGLTLPPSVICLSPACSAQHRNKGWRRLTHSCPDPQTHAESKKEKPVRDGSSQWTPHSLHPHPGNLVSAVKTPDFYHKPLLPGLSRLTKAQEAQEYGPHGSASVRQEAGLSKADRVTGCGRRAVLFIQSDWCRSQGKTGSLLSRQ